MIEVNNMIKIIKIKAILIILINNENGPGHMIYTTWYMIAKVQIWFKSAQHVTRLPMFSLLLNYYTIRYVTRLPKNLQEVLPSYLVGISRVQVTGQVHTSVSAPAAVLYGPNSIDIRRHVLCLTILRSTCVYWKGFLNETIVI